VEPWEAINNPEYRPCAPVWDERDLLAVGDADRALADALQLKRWWEQKEASGTYAEPFELVRTFNRAERVTAFFDTALLNGKNFPVMGLVQEMIFDKVKQAQPQVIRDELREFVLHYFMRISSTQEPQAFIPREQYVKTRVRRAFQPFTLCPEPTDTTAGFGFTQLYYKLRADGFTGKFPAHLQPRIIDLRRMEDIYEWILAQVSIFDFNLVYMPFASGIFSLFFPLREQTYIAISRDFIVNQDDPAPGLLGRYGLGYALLKPAPHKTIFAYGPGHFDAGFQTIDFEINSSGVTRARMVFVSNRPEHVLSIDLDPVSWGFDLADLMTFGFTSQLFGTFRGVFERFSPRIENVDPVTTYITLVNLLTGGLARQTLCASLETLEKNPMLVTHFMEHYSLLSGALVTWRKVQNWLNPADIPESVREGITHDEGA
jgi:hypothetical protein